MEQTLPSAPAESRTGAWLVLASAVAWSSGGSFGRLIGDDLEAWTIVFWRSLWAARFLLGFMLVRDGGRGTLALFRAMGLPGLAVALLFGSSSTAFVLALQYTTVANILLVQAGAPLIAALMAWAAFGERVPGADLGGDRRGALRHRRHGVGLALRCDAPGSATRWRSGSPSASRRRSSSSAASPRVRMVPAVCAGTLFAACFAADLRRHRSRRAPSRCSCSPASAR